MTIQHIEGFNLAGSNADLISSGFALADGILNPTGGRFGTAGYALGTSLTNMLAWVNPFVRYTTVSFWYKVGVNTISRICSCYDTPAGGLISVTDLHAYLESIADGALVIRGDGESIKGTSASGVMKIDTWQHIEIQYDINTAGTCIVYVDGILVLSATGDFLDSSAYTTIQLHGDVGVAVFDDIVFQTDNVTRPDVIGEHKIHTLLPSADTAQADWTGTYADIDDPIGSHDGDTTFITSSTLNAKSEFDLENLSESPPIVHAVKHTTVARKTDAGTLGITQYIDSNGTEEAGTEVGLSETYGTHSTISELNPDGSVAWTETTINALKAGVEITTI